MPFDATPINPAAAILLRARARIIKYGWCQGNYEAPDGRVCAVGAISHRTEFDFSDASQRETAAAAFRHAIGIRQNQAISMWNDARRRTVADVLAAFDRAAAEV